MGEPLQPPNTRSQLGLSLCLLVSLVANLAHSLHQVPGPVPSYFSLSGLARLCQPSQTNPEDWVAVCSALASLPFLLVRLPSSASRSKISSPFALVTSYRRATRSRR